MRDTSHYREHKVLCKPVGKTSCQSGWLRFVIQTFFGLITVVSFILILSMSIQRSTIYRLQEPPPQHHKEKIVVVCSNLNYDDCETNILQSALLSDNEEIELNVIDINFPDGTIPSGWLSHINVNVTSISIYGGNLQRIAPDAFVSSFGQNIRSLELTRVSLNMEANSLEGLNGLRELIINRNAMIITESSYFAPVTNSLRIIKITGSGQWNPKQVTGNITYRNVERVIFSYNNFVILQRSSFFGVPTCKELILSHSNIRLIEIGAFDNLNRIEFLDLKYNQLTTLSDGVLDHIAIFTHGMIDATLNLWTCDCDLEHLLVLSHHRRLFTVDPFCYFPEPLRGSQFSKFKSFCPVIEIDRANNYVVLDSHRTPDELQPYDDDEVSYSMVSKKNGNRACNRNRQLMIRSPVPGHACSSTQTRLLNYSSIESSVLSAQSSSSRFLNPELFISGRVNESLLEIIGRSTSEYALIWFDNECPTNIHCVNMLPRSIKIYNVDSEAQYTLCPLHVATGIAYQDCISYSVSDEGNTVIIFKLRLALFIFSLLGGCSFGALLIYGVIRKNPTLLKGSKRIVLVKHKVADALILPPKVALPPVVSKKMSVMDEYEQELDQPPVWMMPSNRKMLRPRMLSKNCSMRSSKSNAPSYISALQPTEDQMKEWRLQAHFNHKTMGNSNRSSLSPSPISFMYDGEPYPLTEKDNPVELH